MASTTEASTTKMKFAAIDKYFGFKTPVVWLNVVIFSVMHLVALYALIDVLPRARYLTIFFCWSLCVIGLVGVTVGAHRLWSHRSFKATTPARFMLMICFIFSGSYSIATWARDHRMHHRHTDTDADPHSINRGFFFAHMGWFLMKKHPELLTKGKDIDISDVMADPVIQFHQKYFYHLMFGLDIIAPSVFAYYVLGESLKTCILGVFLLRYVVSLHPIWSLNSVAHMYGYKPYNKNICSAQNKAIAIITLGEGWHNFHHTFPWDYRLGEVHTEWKVASNVIDTLAYFGMARDLKYASPELIRKVCLKNQSDEVHPQEVDEAYAEKRISNDDSTSSKPLKDLHQPIRHVGAA